MKTLMLLILLSLLTGCVTRPNSQWYQEDIKDDTLEIRSHINVHMYGWVIHQIKEQKIRKIVLTSAGGDVESGLRLMHYVKDNKIDTEVKGKCSSMCAMIYMGGARRTMQPGALLGFHAPFWVADAPGVAHRWSIHFEDLVSETLGGRYDKELFHRAFTEVTNGSMLWFRENGNTEICTKNNECEFLPSKNGKNMGLFI